MKKLKLFVSVVIILFVVGFVVVSFSRPFNKVSNRREITATVTDKEVKNKKEDYNVPYKVDNTRKRDCLIIDRIG